MYCRKCSNKMTDDASFCAHCGAPKDAPGAFCPHCGSENAADAAACTACGTPLGTAQSTYTPPRYHADGPHAQGPYAPPPFVRSKLAAGLFGIFLGALGVHNFYLGFTTKAVAQLLISVLSCGILSPISAIWGLIEGIMILSGDIYLDADGRTLRD